MVEAHGNLPAEVNGFIGRRDAAAEIKQLLTNARLVTLTGPGGVGKTRLALHVARGLQRAFPDGAWFVGCGELRDPSLIGHLVAASLELTDQSTGSPEEAVVSYVARRRLLLVLDNCEHLIDGLARLVSDILRSAPQVKILATSRESLSVTGEHIYPVSPFPVAHLDLETADPASQREAMELFEQRAAAVVPGFRVDSTIQATVAALCARLDGIPLAIELAAVRVRALSPQRIIERLDDDLDVLASRLRDPTSRHQTLRAAVTWSYDLCTVDERTVWARLSVFPGSFDLDAAVAVCSDERLDRGTVEDTVISLVNKSVVVEIRDGEHGEYRYRLLETLRQYGRDQISPAADEWGLRRRHRDHYLALVQRAAAGWAGAEQVRWATALDQDTANLRAALEYSVDRPEDPTPGLRLASELWFVWIRGSAREGGHWLDRGIAAAPEDTQELGQALWRRGWIAAAQGDAQTARSCLRRAEAIATRLDDDLMHAHVAQARGSAALAEGDPASAAAEFTTAIDHYRTADSWTAIHLLALAELGWMRALLGDTAGAVEICNECRERSEKVGDRWALSWAYWVLGAVAWTGGDHQSARDQLRTCLRLRRDLSDWLGIPFAIELLSWTELHLGSPEHGAMLLGANDALWLPIGRPLFGFAAYTEAHERCREDLRSALGDASYEREYQAGHRLKADDVLALALGETGPSPTARSNGAEILTPREREVAKLVARGMTNRELAQALVISQRTAESHVQRILVKLGLSSRNQVARWVDEFLGQNST